MNILICMLVGILLGWIAFSFLGLNQGRSALVSIVIGAVGGFFGAKVIAPVFYPTVVAVAADAFSLPPLFFAAFAASVFILVGNWVDKRWGV